MSKELIELTYSERCKLFPIGLSKNNPDWSKSYLSEKDQLENIVGKKNICRMSHFGSTAIPNIIAKPTIDILLEIQKNTEIDNLISNMKKAEYIYNIFSPQTDNPVPNMIFLKGYTSNGYEGQVFHLHIRYSGDWDELYFRDYLILYPDIASEYGNIKYQLFQKYEHDREAYTQGKTKFIMKTINQARNEFSKTHRFFHFFTR